MSLMLLIYGIKELLSSIWVAARVRTDLGTDSNHIWSTVY